MTFWSGDKLQANLNNILEDYSADPIDCAAYQLRMGTEVYITPHGHDPDKSKSTVIKLEEKQGFTIPAGQFAFLLTEEKIKIPKNCLGLISMKAKIKFKGLINISGFHVDPGYEGKLVFAVFNAGPHVIHLKRGKPLFLLWIADLDSDASEQYTKKFEGNTSISTEIIPPGSISSMQALQEEIYRIDKEIAFFKSFRSAFFTILKGVGFAIMLAIAIVGLYFAYLPVTDFESEGSEPVGKHKTMNQESSKNPIREETNENKVLDLKSNATEPGK
ncbi:hypothetical protein NBZ79_00520 [Sneathiella marina]|uniref:dUTPase-like domain-containing protein n=1 Tax=Sneathiella marina TaxID=2950108 RepID=A0ABY4W334_9PROT|nr:hypothetical protein [Sneathiella marina]USG61458.1 hypothetical protein NBZ79_00520 [Sneathiella marina]